MIDARKLLAGIGAIPAASVVVTRDRTANVVRLVVPRHVRVQADGPRGATVESQSLAEIREALPGYLVSMNGMGCVRVREPLR